MVWVADNVAKRGEGVDAIVIAKKTDEALICATKGLST